MNPWQVSSESPVDPESAVDGVGDVTALAGLRDRLREATR
jgi:hypothetical protein